MNHDIEDFIESIVILLTVANFAILGFLSVLQFMGIWDAFK